MEPSDIAASKVYIGDISHVVTAEVLTHAAIDVRRFVEQHMARRIADRAGREVQVPLAWTVGRRFKDGTPMLHVCRPEWDVIAVLNPLPSVATYVGE
jgi:hypothetical protein